jgi:PilZ domain
MNEERRRYRRYEVEGLRGTLAGRERHPFQVLTLSRGGLLVTMGFEPPLGQVFDLEILLGPEVFHAPGRTVFVGEDKTAPRERRYRVGFGLEGESPEDGAILDRFLREQLEPQAADPTSRPSDMEQN